MEKYSQIITDVVVVCVLPLVIIVGYQYYVTDESDFSSDLLSSESSVTAPGDPSQLGAKSKEILTELESIKFDATIFSDKAFLSLRDFTPPYYSTSTGREYPFTAPEEVRLLELKSKMTAEDTANSVVGKSATTSTKKTPTTVKPKTP